MIKIFLTVRNRLAITVKCVTALYRHSSIPFVLYVYDNLTNYKVNEHFLYWSMLFEKGLVHQVTFNTKESTFNSFSKAAACNQFGLWHEQDLKRNEYDFLLFLDNDIIVNKGWDEILIKAWKDVKSKNLENIKIITQLPGGIMERKPLSYKIGGYSCKEGKLSGSGFWSVRTNFFKDVGFLNLNKLVGHNKKHDQEYWKLLEAKNKGVSYVLGVEEKLAYHAGGRISGSVCNSLTNIRDEKLALEKISFKESEKELDSMTFDAFYKKLQESKDLHKW
jgi:hypothetical protein